MYYNSVVKSNLAREKNECITDACVNHPQKQSEGTLPKSVGASVGHYESLQTDTSESERADAPSTYAELK